MYNWLHMLRENEIVKKNKEVSAEEVDRITCRGLCSGRGGEIENVGGSQKAAHPLKAKSHKVLHVSNSSHIRFACLSWHCLSPHLDHEETDQHL